MILRSLSIVIGTSLLSSAVWAQAPTPAQVGLTTANPNAVQIRDSSGTWTTIGFIDPATHTFSDTITAGATATSGFPNDGQLLKSVGSKVQPSGIRIGDDGYAEVFYNRIANPVFSIGYNSYPFSYAPFFSLAPNTPLGWWVTPGPVPDAFMDTALWRDGVGTIGERLGTTPQAFRVYKSYTDASNGIWATIDWSDPFGNLTIGPRSNGTGGNAGLILTSDWYGGNITIDQTPGYIGLGDGAIEIGGRLDINSASVTVAGTPGVSCAAGSTVTSNNGIVTACGSGTITAGTSLTSGFTANQLMMSDGTKVQQADGAWVSTSISVSPPGAQLYVSKISEVSNGGSFEMYFTNYGSNFDFASPSSRLRVYNNYSDINNGDWGGLDWQTTPNVLTIGTGANGTGIRRGVKFMGSNATYPFMDESVTNASNITFWEPPVPANPGDRLGSYSNWWNVYASNFLASGGQPTIAASGGTCAVGTKVGGQMAGTVVLTGVCAAGNTITITPAGGAVVNGWVCDAQDRTTQTALFVESATTTSTVTFKTGAVSSVANDVLQWKCIGY